MSIFIFLFSFSLRVCRLSLPLTSTGINEVKNNWDLKLNCSCMFKWLLEVQMFVLRLMPNYFLFCFIILLCEYPTLSTALHRFEVCIKVCSRRFTFMALSFQVCILLCLYCRVYGLANSFLFFSQ
jgi:hypothetical protein